MMPESPEQMTANRGATRPAWMPPRCAAGFVHRWAGFARWPGHYACSTCGIEDDEAWWTENGTYVGPRDEQRVDLYDPAGWALRLPVECALCGMIIRPISGSEWVDNLNNKASGGPVFHDHHPHGPWLNSNVFHVELIVPTCNAQISGHDNERVNSVRRIVARRQQEANGE